MVREHTGYVRNAGWTYDYTVTLENGIVKSIKGTIPASVSKALEKKRYRENNNNLIAMIDCDNIWRIFDFTKTSLVFTDNGELIALEETEEKSKAENKIVPHCYKKTYKGWRL